MEPNTMPDISNTQDTQPEPWRPDQPYGWFDVIVEVSLPGRSDPSHIALCLWWDEDPGGWNEGEGSAEAGWTWMMDSRKRSDRLRLHELLPGARVIGPDNLKS